MRSGLFRSLTLGLALSGLFATSTIVPADAVFAAKKKKKKKEKAEPEQLSPEFVEPYNRAIEALRVQDIVTAEAALREAESTAVSDDEKMRIGNALAQLGGLKKSTNLQREGLELMLASGKVSAADAPRFNYLAGNFAYSDQDYAAAESWTKKAIDLGYTENNVDLIYVDSIIRQNRISDGLSALNNVITRTKQRQGNVPEDYYKRGVRSAYNAELFNETVDWTQKWVAAYPSKTSWRESLSIFRQLAGFDTQTNIDLLRLMRQANALVSEQDYAEYIENADPRRLPGEVVDLIEEGETKGDISTSNSYFAELLSSAKSRVAEDRGSLSAGASSARTSSNPRIAIGTADAYLGYAQYAEAIALYEVALEKPGVDTNLVNTRLGIAQAMSGNFAAAKDAFAKVNGSRKPLAAYWMVWINNQTSSQATAAG